MVNQVAAGSDAGQVRHSRRLLKFAVALAAVIGILVFSALGFLFVRMLDREAIHFAARQGNVAEVERILDRNPARIEQRSRLQLTPLQDAAWEGQMGVVEVLIRHGADVNAEWNLAASGDGRWNSLHIATIQGRTETAVVLIRSGTNINLKSLGGETPLDVAVRNGHGAFVEMLRSQGG